MKPILRDEVYDAVLLRHLHCDREVASCFSREIHVDAFLGERSVGRRVINLNHMKLYGGSDEYTILASVSLCSPLHRLQCALRK